MQTVSTHDRLTSSCQARPLVKFFCVAKVDGDGDCLFHALAYFDGYDGQALRIDVADFLEEQALTQPGFEEEWHQEASMQGRVEVPMAHILHTSIDHYDALVEVSDTQGLQLAWDHPPFGTNLPRQPKRGSGFNAQRPNKKGEASKKMKMHQKNKNESKNINPSAKINDHEERREGGKEGRRKGGKEGRREGGKEGRREGGKEGRREGGKEGRREGGKEKRKEGGKEGRKEGRHAGRQEGRKEGKQAGRQAGR